MEDNNRMDLTQIGWEVVDWIHLVRGTDWQRSFVNTVTNFQVSYIASDFLSG